MKKKRFNEGGFSKAQEEWLGGADRTDPYILARMRRAVPDEEEKSDFETTSGKNKMIGDDTRSRAMDFVNKKESDSKPAIKPKAAAPKPASPKPSVPMADEKEKKRIEEIGKKQALERVEPENYIPGAGMLKGMLKNVVQRGVKAGTSSGLKTIERQALESPTKKLTYESSRSLKPKEYKVGPLASDTAKSSSVTKPMRTVEGMIPKALRWGPTALSDQDDDSKKDNMRKGGRVVKKMASGGRVSSASKRADGCAIRGKTRA